MTGATSAGGCYDVALGEYRLSPSENGIVLDGY